MIQGQNNLNYFKEILMLFLLTFWYIVWDVWYEKCNARIDLPQGKQKIIKISDKILH